MQQQHSSAPSPSPSSPSATALVAASSSPKESRNLYCVLVTSLVSLLLILSFSSFSPSPSSSAAAGRLRPAAGLFSSSPPPPSLAYLLTGSAGDGDRLLRLLRAVYHPKNIYLLHLDGVATADERETLARAAREAPVFQSARNIHVVGRPDFVNTRGSSALSATLHGAAILLRVGADWDWFVNLQASDYPLLTQDDLLHVFSFLPKDLNFVQHSSYIGWRESKHIRPIIVDPGLYLSSRNDVFYTTQKRGMPNAFRLFTGSSSVILSRKFIEYCILGTDNIPRSLLMYYANMASSHTNYFQTVLCNSPEFNRTIINNDLRYMIWDTTSKKEARFLTLDDLENMTLSGAAFGGRFSKNDPVLERIDKDILNRGLHTVVPGGWCLGEGNGNPCTIRGNADVLSPGPQAMVLAKVIVELLSDGRFRSHQCIWD